ncbi:MAG: hypothetical protein U0360_09225 [Dehalococcoidia bacterium]
MTAIIEVKRSFDGARESRFHCELVDLNRDRIVVLFRFERDGRDLDSYGVFWRRRGYNCYYAVPKGGGGAPVFVRFDVVRDVELAARTALLELRYTDLLLDLWVDAAGARWEDEDEVAIERAAGRLGVADAERIERVRGRLERGHPRIAREVRAMLRELGCAV